MLYLATINHFSLKQQYTELLGTCYCLICIIELHRIYGCAGHELGVQDKSLTAQTVHEKGSFDEVKRTNATS